MASASTRASRSRSKERQKHRGERQHPRHDRRNLVNRRGHEVPSVTTLVEELAPSLVGICGCGPLTAAKILGETADVRRFRSNDAYARHNGTAPLPVWSSNRARHRLSRRGNRQLNAAIHRIALTQAHYHPGARALIARRRANGDGGLEALRVLKRRLSDVVYQALLTDAAAAIAQST